MQTLKMSPPPVSATGIHVPQWPRHFEQVRKPAGTFYPARNGMMGMTLHDWLDAEQELERNLKFKSPTNGKTL